MSRVELSRVRTVFKYYGSARVGPSRPDAIRPARRDRSDPSKALKMCYLYP